VLNMTHRFFSQNILLLPTLLFPPILPWSITCSNQYLSLFLIMCPRYSNFRVFIVFNNYFSFCILYSTHTLDTRSIHEMFKIRMNNHISKASIFMFNISVNIHVSAPYSKKVKMCYLSILNLVPREKSWHLNILNIFMNALLAISIRHLISFPCSHSSFNHVPRHLYFWTFSICCPLINSFYLEFRFLMITIYLILFTLRDNP
jgi:hypothetical protein